MKYWLMRKRRFKRIENYNHSSGRAILKHRAIIEKRISIKNNFNRKWIDKMVKKEMLIAEFNTMIDSWV